MRQGASRSWLRLPAAPESLAASSRARLGSAVIATAAVLLVAYAGWRTPSTYRRFAVPCPEELCSVLERPNEQTLRVASALGLTAQGWALAMLTLCWALLLVAIVVASTLARRAPAQPVSVVTAILVLATAAGPFGDGERLWLMLLIGCLLPIFLGLFPTGTWSPGWLRLLWPAAVVLFTFREIGPPLLLVDVLYLAFFVGVPLHRFWRVSDWSARQQTKWPLLGVLVLAGNQAVVLGAAVGGWLAQAQALIVGLDYLGVGLVLSGVGLALARHRLFDVDLLVRRATVYLAAVVLLVAVYVVAVVAAGATLSDSQASAVGGLAVGGVSAVAAYLARGWLRRGLLGARGTPGATGAAMARDLSGSGAELTSLASTIATLLDAPFVLVRRGGDVVSRHGDGQVGLVVPVPGRDGSRVATLELSPPGGGRRIGRSDRRAVHELLPFVALVLHAEHEAEELRAARARAGTSREEERQRLRSDLHDGVGPLLATQLLTLDALRAGSPTRAPELDQLEETTRGALAEIRRIAQDLRPAALEAGGLAMALESEAARFSTAGLPVSVDVRLHEVRLGAAHETAFFRIAQEALSNAARHGSATTCRLSVTNRAGVVELTVVDDGRGLGRTRATGTGMESMRHRAEELCGELLVGPGPNGVGVSVLARIPS